MHSGSELVPFPHLKRDGFVGLSLNSLQRSAERHGAAVPPISVIFVTDTCECDTAMILPFFSASTRISSFVPMPTKLSSWLLIVRLHTLCKPGSKLIWECAEGAHCTATETVFSGLSAHPRPLLSTPRIGSTKRPSLQLHLISRADGTIKSSACRRSLSDTSIMADRSSVD